MKANTETGHREPDQQTVAPDSRLSTYPSGNLEEVGDDGKSDEANTDAHGRTMAEATDPDKLSDI